MIRIHASVALHTAGDIDGLRAALQAAIELEHATIPPYLYALYSIRPTKNVRITNLPRQNAPWFGRRPGPRIRSSVS